MLSTVSVSKGVFVFKNGAKAASKKSRKKKPAPSANYFSDALWYQTYRSLWDTIETKIQNVNDEMFSNVLSNLVSHIKQCYKIPVSEIPSAALLTGINMPDHSAQFGALSNEIKHKVSPHVAILNSEDCQTLKNLVEIMLNQLIRDDDDDDDLTDEDDSERPNRIKKSQCNFALLQSWYENLYLQKTSKSPSKKQKIKDCKKVIVVIIPDFEGFSNRVLHDFISIASTYINILPFVFIFGVATSVTVLHQSLPYHVSCKVNIQVFNSTPSILYLNNILENILFSQECPFHLGGKVFNLFTDIFLFYDLSVSNFIQNVKYAMLEHFGHGNAMALCRYNFKQHLSEFTKDDYENARRLLSFRKLVENQEPEIRLLLLLDDDYFRETLKKEVKKIIKYIKCLHLFIKCLHVLVCDLPKAPLGKQIRELYSIVVSRNLTKTQEYKECFQLLGFQSQEELCDKLTKLIGVLTNNISDPSVKLRDVEKVTMIIKQLTIYKDMANNLDFTEEDTCESSNSNELIGGQMDRQKLKEKLLMMSKQSKPMNKYEKIRKTILDYLSNLFETYLVEPSSFYFHEIFFFNEISVQNHIIGSHRAAIHTALNEPQFYLQCSCCEIPNDSVILPTMPDISIVYKLHLECGKMINLYDWLQAFISIVDPQSFEEDEKKPKVHPRIQARFTQAVAELEFLGFIKSSKRKTDHVARLTWGG